MCPAALGPSLRERNVSHVKPRVLVPVAGAVALLCLLVSLSIATAGTTRPAKLTSAAAIAPPAVPNAAAIKKKYGGQKITFIGDNAVGSSHTRDVRLAAKFTAQTGIKVKVVPHPVASDAAYAQLARAFSSHSSSIDVAMLDVVWPGAFAPFLVDLKPALGKQAKLHAQGIIQNDTVGGTLVAMPWFADFGILYYRTDLLKKYGYFSAPPKTWDRARATATTIQERRASRTTRTSTGFVWQGSAYEGLTCDAPRVARFERRRHHRRERQVTINNPQAVAILDMIRGWVGTIAPRERHHLPGRGRPQRLRRRATPPSCATGRTPIAGPEGRLTGGRQVRRHRLPLSQARMLSGCIGGWALAVSKYSKSQDAAIEFARYLSSSGISDVPRDRRQRTCRPSPPSRLTRRSEGPAVSRQPRRRQSRDAALLRNRRQL